MFAGDFYRTENFPGRNMYWDVKDFNWLRSLKKSPNFTVIEITKDNEGGGANAKNLAGIADKSTANEVDSEDEL